MKKKLLATAVAALVAAPMMAQADVKVFGSVQAELYSRTQNTAIDNAAGTTISDMDTYTGQMADNGQGQLGVTADEDLGGGMTGYAKVNLNTGTVARTANEGLSPEYRDIYLGLKGGFGDVRMGRMSGIYKSLGGVSWDPFLTTMLEARGNAGMTGGADGHSSYLDRALYYGSPKLGPVQLHAAYTFDYQDTENNLAGATDQPEGRENESHYQIGANANFGPAEVIFAHSNLHQRGDDRMHTKLGARFAFGGAHTISVQAESLAHNVAGTVTPLADSRDHSGLQTFVGWEGTFGNIKPAVSLGLLAEVTENGGSYTWTNAAGTATTTTTTGDVVHAEQYIALGANWMMSKTFRLYGGVRINASVTEYEDVAGNVIAEETSTDQVLSIGMRKSF